MKNLRLSSLARAARWHRKGLGAAALLVAALAALNMLAPQPETGVPVVVAVRALPPGVELAAADLAVVQAPPDLLPDGAFDSAEALVGRSLAVGQPAGSMLTADDLSGSGLADRAAGEVLAPFKARDADVVALLRVGDLITVVQGGYDSAAQTVAQHVRVAIVPRPDSASALVVVAADPQTAQALAAAYDSGLGIVIE